MRSMWWTVLAGCTAPPGGVEGADPRWAMRPFLDSGVRIESGQEFAYLGGAVATAGDVNGDGFDDLIVGADGFDDLNADVGAAYVYAGSSTGIGVAPLWALVGDQAAAHYGFDVASAGDVNGDGYDDIVVGADEYDGGQVDEGRVDVFLGTASGPEAVSSWTVEGNADGAFLGRTVAGAGDIDGDGYADLLVGGDAFESTVSDAGLVLVFRGSATGLEATPSAVVVGDQAFSGFGTALAGAGDTDGDGYDDVVIGAPYRTATLSGEGRAQLFRGSASGLEATASWTVDGHASTAAFGGSVDAAGDVDGDGYADVVVGAWGYTNGQNDEGRALVYHGSATGLETSERWSTESNQTNAWYGAAVAGVGDLDGDGYSDVAVGAMLYDAGQTDEGRLYVYRGSAAGLGATYAWSHDENQAAARLGWALAAAGDVDGDGYDDLVVGAPFWDTTVIDEGAVFTYFGACFDSVDTDLDTVGDACDRCPGYDDRSDVDQDGVPDGCDLCPNLADPDQTDTDADGVGDACDRCPVDAPNDFDNDGSCASVDCDDTDASVHPGAPEACNGRDDACTGAVPADEVDADGDGFMVCAGDCADDDGTRYPGAAELCDGVDAACDGLGDEVDADGDGVRVCDADCDDTDADIFPGAPERCNGLDDACNGAVPADEVDADGDGVRVCADDCDDADPEVFPGAPERCNGVDDGCSGAVPVSEADADGDGVRVCDDDCDDADPEVFPGAPERCNGVDDACSGAVPADEADADGDGVRVCDDDCDDADPAVAATCDPPPTTDGKDPAGSGCGCRSSGSPVGAAPLLALLLARRRRVG